MQSLNQSQMQGGYAPQPTQGGMHPGAPGSMQTYGSNMQMAGMSAAPGQYVGGQMQGQQAQAGQGPPGSMPNQPPATQAMYMQGQQAPPGGMMTGFAGQPLPPQGSGFHPGQPMYQPQVTAPGGYDPMNMQSTANKPSNSVTKFK